VSRPVRNSKFEIIRIILIIISLVISYSACEDKTDIPEEKFIKIYVDLLVMQDTTVTNPVSLDSMKALIFSRFNITNAQYERKIALYNSSPEKWEKFFDKAIAYVEEMKVKRGK
jgi:hypothetical protein